MDSPSKKRRRLEPTLGEKAMEYFEYEKTIVCEKGNEKKYYKCLFCKELKNGTKEGNLASHLQYCNPSIYSDISGGKKNPLPIERLKLLQHCTEVVSVNGRPFNALLDSGFQSIIAQKLEKLRKGGCSLNLHDSNLTEVKKHLSETAKNVRAKIRSEVKGRIIGLLVDIVSKNHRSILGVSIQHVFEKKLRIRSIGMIDLDKAHTGVYLAQTIIKRLKEYEVEPPQILTITTDNGANVLKMIRDFDDLLESSVNVSETNKHQTQTKKKQIARVFIA